MTQRHYPAADTCAFGRGKACHAHKKCGLGRRPDLPARVACCRSGVHIWQYWSSGLWASHTHWLLINATRGCHRPASRVTMMRNADDKLLRGIDFERVATCAAGE